MELNLKVVKLGNAVGTLAWLLEKADHVKVCQSKDGLSRGAWLVGADGKTVVCLALLHQPEDFQRTDREDGLYLELLTRGNDENEVGSDVPWTDAAWAAVEKLRDAAVPHLEEPADLAQALRVKLEPVTNTAGVLLDHLKEEGIVP